MENGEIVKAATRTSGWVITGGTASGVMDIVGKAGCMPRRCRANTLLAQAMQRHDKQRQARCRHGRCALRLR